MNIETVQRRLWEQSQEHKRVRETEGTLFRENPWKYRIRGLYDLMHNPEWIAEACHRVLVRSRRKASGVDKETVWRFEQNRERNLENLRLELKHGTYQPQPARRVMIDKDGGRERPLGIPCLRDKMVQEAMRMALEPIYEIEFHPDSYGFRPHRSAHHAVARCQNLLKHGFSWVIEGDVKACFDNITHDSILRELREKVMDTAGLELSAAKTHITHVRDGFDFLGFRISKGVGRRGNEVPKIKIGEKAKARMRLRLSQVIHFRSSQESMSLRIERASRLIRGWREYYRVAHNPHSVAHTLDYHAFWEAVKAGSSKFDITTAQCLKRYSRHGFFTIAEGCRLEKISGTELKVRVRKPEEYTPGNAVYLNDNEEDSTYSYREPKRRVGCRDARWEVMVRDSLCCRKCGALVDYSTAHIDHIVPVKRFASYRQAHVLENLQTLCIQCHKEKTNAERHSQR